MVTATDSFEGVTRITAADFAAELAAHASPATPAAMAAYSAVVGRGIDPLS